jgi:hypothetical protein
MSAGSMQTTRNFVIPYLIYFGLTYTAPKSVLEALHRWFPDVNFVSIDLENIILPIGFLVLVHLLFDPVRRWLNTPFFNRVNSKISDRFAAELGEQYRDWPRIRPAFYHVVDSDGSLSQLSSRIKHNGLIWFGFTDLRLASILTFAAWGIGAIILYSLERPDYTDWMRSGVLSLLLLLISAVGSEVTTRRHERLIGEQLDQMFPLHRDDVLAALARGRA